MKRSFFLLALAMLCGVASMAHAQTSPGWTYGFVPTPAQWNAAFASKQDYLGAAPCLLTGCTLTGELVAAPSTATGAGFNLGQGTAPSSPNNGDFWMTSAGVFAQVNGSTVGPFGAGATGFANPTATAGPNAVNGSATTAMRSDAAPSIQKGSNAQFGIVEGDGSTISCTAGICSSLVSILLSGTVLAKTGAYAAVTGDCGRTITLGGSAQYALTLNAASGYTSNCGFLITNLSTETQTKTISPNGLSSFFLYPGQSVVVSNQNNTWNVGPIAGRWRLTSAVTFYIRPDGSDSNDGLANSTGGAFLTANAAIAAVASNVDINNRTDLVVKHTCASPPCTITAPAQLLALSSGIPFTGGIPAYQGDCTTPSNVVLAPSSADFADIQVTYAPTALNICGFTLAGAANVTYGLYVSGGARANVTGPMGYGDITAAAGVSAHINVISGGRVIVFGNEAINNSTGTTPFHYAVQRGSVLEVTGSITLTCSGTPPFTIFAFAGTNGSMFVNSGSVTFSGCGSVTGKRYDAQSLATINTNGGGANFFPGNVAGTISTTTPGGGYF